MSRKIKKKQILNIYFYMKYYISKPDEFFGKVSWSDKSVQYYLHTIDHSKLAHYYERIHQLHTKGIRSM
jgi:hypothetical protein